MDKSQQTELEAAAFRRLLKHLDSRKDVQNIELMNVSGMAEAEERHIEMDYDQAREHIYGMPYSEWKANHQLPATPEQMAVFESLQNKK